MLVQWQGWSLPDAAGTLPSDIHITGKQFCAIECRFGIKQEGKFSFKLEKNSYCLECIDFFLEWDLKKSGSVCFANIGAVPLWNLS